MNGSAGRRRPSLGLKYNGRDPAAENDPGGGPVSGEAVTSPSAAEACPP